MIGLLLVLGGVQAQTLEFPDLDVASLRTRAMAGAATAVAEGPSSLRINPASLAVRRPFSPELRWEVDTGLQIRQHPWLRASWDWLGFQAPPMPRTRSIWQLGVVARVERVGTAFQAYEHAVDGEGGVWLSRWFTAGFGTSGPTWSIGVTPHLVSFRRNPAGLNPSGRAFGGGATMGGLWAPRDSPYRLGATLRSPMRTTALDDGSRMRVPFEASIGVSRMFGAWNRPGRYGPVRTTRDRGGDWVMVDVDLVMTGSGADALALEPHLAGQDSAVGGPTMKVRAGVALATWEARLRIRAGVASVPARGDVGGVQGAVGATIRAFRVGAMEYRVGGAFGLSPRGWWAGLGTETW